MKNLSEYSYALMRIAFGILFWFHGAQKLFGVFGGSARPFGTQLWVAGVIEVAVGALIALGALTPWIALLGAAEMAYAYAMSHAPRGTWPIQNGGELALLYLFAFLFMATRGSGVLSVDRLRR